MPEPSASLLQPTPHDINNARMRQAIADRQNAEYDACQALGEQVLGPGWQPWMKLVLIDSDYHQGASQEPVAVAYKVYRGEERLTENSVFARRMPDGQVRSAANYEELFGDLLHEEHLTRRLEIKGKLVPAPKWTLCWASLERYEPKSAEQLAALRVSREVKKAEREQRKFQEETPLWAMIEKAEREQEERGR